MNKNDKPEQFNRELDDLLDGEGGAWSGEDAGRRAAARRLAAADFSDRSRRRDATRAALLQEPPARRWLFRLAAPAGAAALLLLIVSGIAWLVSGIPNQPAVTAAPAPLANQVIAFQSDRDGNEEIYRMDGDGGNPVNLTRHPAADTAPAWSPNGAWIAFFSDRTGKNEVFVMDIEGGQLRQLTDDSSLAWYGPLAWSSDGAMIALTGSQGSDDENDARIYLVDVAAGAASVFLPDTPAKSPLWTGGGQLAFVNRDAESGRSALVFTVGTSDPGPGRVTVQSERAAENDAESAVILGLAAAPDGGRVAALTLYWVPVPDSELMRDSHVGIETWDRGGFPLESLLRIKPIPNGILGLSWSPDGAYLAFAQSVGMSGCWYVHVLRLSDLEEAVAEGLCVTVRTLEPDWTPDGQWLVYSADDDGSFKDYGIVAVNMRSLFDDPQNPVVRRLTANDGTSENPQVRPVRVPNESAGFNQSPSRPSGFFPAPWRP